MEGEKLKNRQVLYFFIGGFITFNYIILYYLSCKYLKKPRRSKYLNVFAQFRKSR